MAKTIKTLPLFFLKKKGLYIYSITLDFCSYLNAFKSLDKLFDFSSIFFEKKMLILIKHQLLLDDFFLQVYVCFTLKMLSIFFFIL